MGLLAQYMMIDDQTFRELVDLENDDLFDMIEELNENGENEICDIDKMWDGLHFLLTGTSACQPIEEDKLSKAVIGIKSFNSEDEDAEFIAYTMTDNLPGIIAALNKVDIEKLRLDFELSKFRKAKIYPDIWREEDKDILFDELTCACKDMLSFYKKAEARKAHVVVSIY